MSLAPRHFIARYPRERMSSKSGRKGNMRYQTCGGRRERQFKILMSRFGLGHLENKESGHPVKDARMHAPCLELSQLVTVDISLPNPFRIRTPINLDFG